MEVFELPNSSRWGIYLNGKLISGPCFPTKEMALKELARIKREQGQYNENKKTPEARKEAPDDESPSPF